MELTFNLALSGATSPGTTSGALLSAARDSSTHVLPQAGQGARQAPCAGDVTGEASEADANPQTATETGPHPDSQTIPAALHAAPATQPLEPIDMQSTLEQSAARLVDKPAVATAGSSVALQETLRDAAGGVGQPRPEEVKSALKLNPSWPLVASDEWKRMADFAALLQVRVHLVEAARQRLLDLWDAVLMIGADEIGDWALPARCEVTASGGQPVPDVLGICATVYADGTVSLYVQLEGIDAPFWLEEQVQLEVLNRQVYGPQGPYASGGTAAGLVG